MKKIYLSACILMICTSLTSFGQAKKNTAAKAPAKANNTTMTNNTHKNDQASAMQTTGVQYEVINGVRVILKHSTNNVVSAVLFITGGVKNYDVASQGIENLAMNVVLDGGSKKYSKEQWHNLMEQKGISLDANSSYDYSAITVKTIDKNWATSFDMLADAINHPTWDDKSFEQVKGQIVSGLMQEQSDPDSKIRDMSITSTFKGTAYESNPDGTAEVVNALDMDKLKAHYTKIMHRKKFILSVVGKISMAELRTQVANAFSSLPEGAADPFVSNPPHITSPSVTIEEREIATNYIQGIYSAPPVGTRENIAMRIGSSILSDRLFIEIRTKRNLSYAPAAYVATMFNPYGSVYVSTTQPNDAVQVMMDEIRKIKKEGFSEKELRDKKEGFLTAFYMGQETNHAQALTYGLSELRGDWHHAETFKDEVYSLTTKELNEVYKKYATSIAWYYLGDRSKVDESIFKSKLE